MHEAEAEQHDERRAGHGEGAGLEVSDELADVARPQGVVQGEREHAGEHQEHHDGLDRCRVVVGDRLVGDGEPAGGERGEEQADGVLQCAQRREAGDEQGDEEPRGPRDEEHGGDARDEARGPQHVRQDPVVTGLGRIQRADARTTGAEQGEDDDDDPQATGDLQQMAVERHRRLEVVEIVHDGHARRRQRRGRLEQRGER